VKQASGDGILDGQHTDDIAVLMHMLEDFLERVATNQFDFVIREELVCGDVVERTGDTLYSNSFHTIEYLSSIKNPASLRSGIP
jgi:hypothetical protein